MGRHLADSMIKIDQLVYERLAAKGKVTYSKCNPSELLKQLEIPWGYRHDVFCSLKRLDEAECISKEVVTTRPVTHGRSFVPAARDVTYLAIKPPAISTERSAPIFCDAVSQYA